MNRSLSTPTPSARLMSRREMLEFMGTAAAVTIFGCGRGQSAPPDSIGGENLQSTAVAAAIPSCVVRPEQTEGPYFIDEKLNRSDIRSEPSDGSIRQGVPLRLAFQVSRVEGGSCAPLSGARVDIWQCDAVGVYSDVRDMNVDSRGKKFLRGYQVTNTGGSAEFLTIYPGWYPGRAVHIHFKVRNDPASRQGSQATPLQHQRTPHYDKRRRFRLPARRKTTHTNVDQGFGRLRSEVRYRSSDDLTLDLLLSSKESDLDKQIAFTAIFTDRQHTFAMADAMLHFFNHQAHHRGQLTTLISQLGYDYPIAGVM